MPNIVVEIPTTTPELCLRLNCISIKNNKARTMNKSSQLLVGSNLNTIDNGITAPIHMPKYLYMLIPLF
jgi:hypothetical protein